MLLYAKTGEEFQPKNEFKMDANTICVNSLDLSLPFEKIKDQLEDIVINYLLVEENNLKNILSQSV